MTATKKSKIAMVMSCIAAGLAAITCLAATLGLANNANTTKSVNSFDFARGAIESTGKVVESNQNLVTKSAITVDGMAIEIDDENATISYKVAFYDENDEFISMTEEQVENFDTDNVPANAKTFKVMITPNQVDGEPVKLNVFNQNKYLKQIKITYSRE